MNSIIMFGIFVLMNLASCVFTQAIHSYSRDGYGRYDPNKLLNGFFPAWAILMLCIAGDFINSINLSVSN